MNLEEKEKKEKFIFHKFQDKDKSDEKYYIFLKLFANDIFEDSSLYQNDDDHANQQIQDIINSYFPWTIHFQNLIEASLTDKHSFLIIFNFLHNFKFSVNKSVVQFYQEKISSQNIQNIFALSIWFKILRLNNYEEKEINDNIFSLATKGIEFHIDKNDHNISYLYYWVGVYHSWSNNNLKLAKYYLNLSIKLSNAFALKTLRNLSDDNEDGEDDEDDENLNCNLKYMEISALEGCLMAQLEITTYYIENAQNSNLDSNLDLALKFNTMATSHLYTDIKNEREIYSNFLSIYTLKYHHHSNPETINDLIQYCLNSLEKGNYYLNPIVIEKLFGHDDHGENMKLLFDHLIKLNNYDFFIKVGDDYIRINNDQHNDIIDEEIKNLQMAMNFYSYAKDNFDSSDNRGWAEYSIGWLLNNRIRYFIENRHTNADLNQFQFSRDRVFKYFQESYEKGCRFNDKPDQILTEIFENQKSEFREITNMIENIPESADQEKEMDKHLLNDRDRENIKLSFDILHYLSNKNFIKASSLLHQIYFKGFWFDKRDWQRKEKRLLLFNLAKTISDESTPNSPYVFENYLTGWYYLNGRGTYKDDQLAEFYFQKSLEHDSDIYFIDAKICLAKLLMNKKFENLNGDENIYQKQAHKLLKECEADYNDGDNQSENIDAMYYLADCYLENSYKWITDPQKKTVEILTNLIRNNKIDEGKNMERTILKIKYDYYFTIIDNFFDIELIEMMIYSLGGKYAQEILQYGFERFQQLSPEQPPSPQHFFFSFFSCWIRSSNNI